MDKEVWKKQYVELWENKWIDKIVFDGDWAVTTLIDRYGNRQDVRCLLDFAGPELLDLTKEYPHLDNIQ